MEYKYEIRQHDLGYFFCFPTPPADFLNKYYRDQYFLNVDKRTGFEKVYSPEEVEYFISKIEQKYNIIKKQISGKGSFLDIGCGEGFTMEFYYKKGWNVTGIDYSDIGIKRMNPNQLVNFMMGDSLEFIKQENNNNKKYRLLNMGNVLEHVPDPINVLYNIKTIMDVDSIITITVPNDFSKYQEFLFSKGFVDKKYWVAFPRSSKLF